MAREDHRPLGLVDHGHGALEFGSRREGRDVAQMPGGHRLLPLEGGLALLGILGDVHQHGTRAPAGGHGEGLANGRGDVLGPGHQVVVLGDRQGDARDVHLLEGVRAQQARAHLPRDGDQGDGVQHGRGQARHQVGGAGS